MILTDTEIKAIGEGNQGTWQDDLQFARAVIAAYEAKMNSAEPVAYGWFEDGDMKAMSFCDIPYTPQFSPNAIKTPLFTHPAPSADDLEAAYKRGRHDAVVDLIGNEPMAAAARSE